MWVCWRGSCACSHGVSGGVGEWGSGEGNVVEFAEEDVGGVGGVGFGVGEVVVVAVCDEGVEGVRVKGGEVVSGVYDLSNPLAMDMSARSVWEEG